MAVADQAVIGDRWITRCPAHWNRGMRRCASPSEDPLDPGTPAQLVRALTPNTPGKPPRESSRGRGRLGASSGLPLGRTDASRSRSRWRGTRSEPVSGRTTR
jgi:hypothetical protein